MRNSTTILILSISIALGVFYIRPQYKNLKTLQTEESQYTEALSKTQELKTLRDSLLDKYNSIDKNSIDLLKKVVPEEFDPVKLMANINDMAGRHGMILSEVTTRENIQSSGRSEITEDPSPEKLYKTVQISFTLKGGYENFIKTLQDIEKNIQIVDVKKLSIKEENTLPQIKSLVFELAIDSYWLK